ncbi:non-hydrolyzing UDP-N-acetylglucosamine 2-epimerase [Limnospira sp. PMC 917.15]|uniref:non-hydrolyzing UDP-N-acetylglucosamine 2-epimerase n=1 Tax=Limnospira sp. PMC 917.15 TaxID=2981106 RepID=UPI0028E0CC05|nr:UDP-N-acetylglucosamine 2-epimerase (non-hydrolyzing) [Limnospira sp. PMC 917.15]MDT9235075.1 UDP-N-acetylglucosamine 2-epimerase (non-hydrolyzing) [Limnospira sp. PMC 917.15]
MKIITILGARPQFIKSAVVSSELKKIGFCEEVIVHTGQHYDDNMSKIFFEQLSLQSPKYNLGVGSGTHGYQTGMMMIRLEEVILEEKPTAIIVYGDTNSTVAGSLVAAKLQIKAIHIEAGLRSWNRSMPEEINRVVSDHLADILFSPTETSVTNLINEGISKTKIELVGDVMYDVFLRQESLSKNLNNALEKHNLKKGDYILATLHRAENTDNVDRLKAIITALNMLGQKFQVIMPLHPRTLTKLKANLLVKDYCDIKILKPVGYLEMYELEANSRLICTDSGGVQKEAYFHRVPCVTYRHETEWIELVSSGWNYLVEPTDAESIYQTFLKAIETEIASLPEINYGGGKASEEIAKKIVSYNFV